MGDFSFNGRRRPNLGGATERFSAPSACLESSMTDVTHGLNARSKCAESKHAIKGQYGSLQKQIVHFWQLNYPCRLNVQGSECSNFYASQVQHC